MVGGAILGGFIIGILENLAGGYINPILPGFKDVAPFIVLVFILMITQSAIRSGRDGVAMEDSMTLAELRAALSAAVADTGAAAAIWLSGAA